MLKKIVEEFFDTFLLLQEKESSTATMKEIHKFTLGNDREHSYNRKAVNKICPSDLNASNSYKREQCH